MRLIKIAGGAVWFGLVMLVAVILVTPAIAVAWTMEKVDELRADPTAPLYEV